MNYKIALIKGDGIGPEVVGEAVKVMEAVGEKFGHKFDFTEVLMGGCATDAVGVSYPEGTAEACKACDAVLLGAVGGPKWGSDKPAHQRPETALLAIRKDLGLYANLRPAVLRPATLLCFFTKFCQNISFSSDRNIFRLKIIFRANSHLTLWKIPYMTIGSHNFIICTKKLFNCIYFRW